MRPVAVALVCLLALGSIAVSPTAGSPDGAIGEATSTTPGTPAARANGSESGAGPRLVAVAPNPVADGDRGEFVVVRVPPPSDLDGMVLADGEQRIRLDAGNRTPAGRVALTPAPEAARVPAGTPVVRAPLSLANGGERLHLVRNGRTVDVLRYADAPAGELRTDDGWRPIGATSFPVVRTDGGAARAFVLPDAPDAAVAPLANASRRILLAGYTLSDPRVRDRLLAAADRGVGVRVLVEGGPVGGITRREARTLDALARGGVAVRVVDGPYARYEFHHAKYAVVDDRALVLTENWKPSGTGGRDNRGWGVRVASGAVAADLAGLFARDFGAHDARRWGVFRRDRTFTTTGTADGSYPSRFDPERVRARRVRVLTAPGNAEGAVVGVVDGAERRVDVVQPSLGDPDTPLVRSLLRAAERGVRVRVLLSGAWYVEAENRALVERLNGRASRRDLPLEARIAEPNGRYGSIHAKGVVADDVVLVGSLNWNVDSARENREVVLALTGADVAAYYRRVFTADWRGGPRAPPAGLALAAAVAVGLALAYLRRRVSFG